MSKKTNVSTLIGIFEQTIDTEKKISYIEKLKIKLPSTTSKPPLISICDKSGKKIDHLPLVISESLRKLAENERIDIDATAFEFTNHYGKQIKANLAIYAKDRSILSPKQMDDPAQAFHGFVAAAFKAMTNCQHVNSAKLQHESLVNLMKDLGLAEKDLLPETILLLTLIHQQVKRMEIDECNRIWMNSVDAIQSIKIGDPIQFEEFAIYPLYTPSPITDCIMLTELDPSKKHMFFNNNELKISNHSDKLLIIPASQILMVNHHWFCNKYTLFIPPGAKTRIEISKSEKTYAVWDQSNPNNYESILDRRSGYHGPVATGMYEEMADFRTTIPKPDDFLITEHDNDVFKIPMGSSFSGDFKRFARHFFEAESISQAPKGASGVMIFWNDVFFMIDLFPSPKFLEASWDCFVRSLLYVPLAAAPLKSDTKITPQQVLAKMSESVIPFGESRFIGSRFSLTSHKEEIDFSWPFTETDVPLWDTDKIPWYPICYFSGQGSIYQGKLARLSVFTEGFTDLGD